MDLILNKTAPVYQTIGILMQKSLFDYGDDNLVGVYTIRKNNTIFEYLDYKTNQWKNDDNFIVFKFNPYYSVNKKLNDGEILHIVYENDVEAKRIICLFSETFLDIFPSGTVKYTDTWAIVIDKVLIYLNKRHVYTIKLDIKDTSIEKFHKDYDIFKSVKEYIKYRKIPLKTLFTIPK